MTRTPSENPGWLEQTAKVAALAGFALYAVAAPHSIAISWIGISIAVIAWLLRLVLTRRTGLRRTPLDLPLWLFFAWTVLSCVFSTEPRISLPKIVNAATFLFFYLTQSLLMRKTILLMAGLMILSASAGVLWGAGELIVGRGVIVKGLRANSPLRIATPLREGDAVWRVNGKRVSTASAIDDAVRNTPVGTAVKLSVISRGEHVEWIGPPITIDMQQEPSPSGITGGGRTHSFRASGWTRHYETFAELLQIIAQLALGLTLARWMRRKLNAGRARILLLAAGFLVIAAGIALTAMRTTLVAFAIGALVLAWRAARGRQRAAIVAVLVVVLGLGVFSVWRTRAGGALELTDPSSSRRVEVARIAARRVLLHPLFGHGMDAVHAHWNEWGFPGTDMLHAHSTPIQLAFDRGLPALIFWIWLIYAFWKFAASTEHRLRASDDTNAHGLTLGIIGALSGFIVSSIVNYNFGDSEVALLVWWMMGAAVVFKNDE